MVDVDCKPNVRTTEHNLDDNQNFIRLLTKILV